MPALPLPVRVAAGLAATVFDEARNLPTTVTSLPVTAVSQVLQSFMRAQQQLTALAIRGDELLSFLSPAAEAPEWATFDEDLAPTGPGPTDRGTAPRVPVATPPPARPSRNGRFALYSQVPADVETNGARPTPATAKAQAEAAADLGVAPLPGYDAMTLAQLRARLRTLSVTELEDTLLHERAGQAREPFLTMLSNRIAKVRAQ
ncbi:MAG: lipid droplet-associated protein [Mycobacteriaceae bacterium]